MGFTQYVIFISCPYLFTLFSDIFLIHFTPSFKLEKYLADVFLHHYSIESGIPEIYELFYIIISDLTKNSPDCMMLRLGEGDIMHDLIQLIMLLVEFD